MEGITTALVVFILLAVAFPVLIRNRPQFWSALATVVAIILLDAVAHVIHSDAFIACVYFFSAILQITALVLIVLSAGGLTVGQFKAELHDLVEAFQTGEVGRDRVVPLRGEKPNPAPSNPAPSNPGPPKPARPNRAPEEERKVFTIDDVSPPAIPRSAPPKPAKPPEPPGPLPLE